VLDTAQWSVSPFGMYLYIAYLTDSCITAQHDFFKDWFIALRCTVVYTNYHKTVRDSSVHERSDVM
jgi:hypothetical protein